MKLTIILLLIIPSICLANTEHFFVCGPDEDGCYPEIYQYCLCVPVDEKTKSTPYCLNFDEMSCKPLANVKKCANIFRDQASCVATMLQRESYPPCPIKTASFCQTNHIDICQLDLGLANC